MVTAQVLGGKERAMRTTTRALWGTLALSLVGSLAGAGIANAAITSTNATNDSSNIKYVYQYSTAGSFYRTYIDSDVNAATGFAANGVGADYLLEGGFLYRYVGPGWNWSQIGTVTYSNTANTASWTFSRASIGETNCTNETAKAIFEVQLSNGTFDRSSIISQSFIPCSSALTDNVTTNGATNVYYTMQYTGSWSLFHVFIDTDQNTATGYATGGIGADYFVENGTLFQHTGGSSSWTWNNLGAVTAYSNTGSAASWTVSRAAMGETQANESANLFYHVQSSTSSAQLPVYTHVYFGSTGSGGGSTATGSIVPLYSYPTTSYWAAIIAAKNSHPTVPVVAIVNPNSGPGTSVDSNYTTGIANLQAAGITVIGYVYTSYGSRAQADVQDDINAWKSFYPSVTGIFFDEMANDNNTTHVAYYQSLDGYARSKGFTYTVGNPGTDTLPIYVGVVNTILVYESSGIPASLPTWYASYAPSNFGVIPYNVPTLDMTATNFIASARQTIGYIYLTNDNLPNPWDTLPSYFSTLLTDLQ